MSKAIPIKTTERTSSLLTEHIELLREAFRYTRNRHPFEIDAIVVLPEHLHTIWTLPAGDCDYAMRWRLIKNRFSRSIPKGERISRSRLGKGERGIWQRRYWEHTLRDELDSCEACGLYPYQSGEAWACEFGGGMALLFISPPC